MNNTTLVLVADKMNARSLAPIIALHQPNPVLVFTIGLRRRDEGRRFLQKQPGVSLYPWKSDKTETKEELKEDAFLFGAAKNVQTELVEYSHAPIMDLKWIQIIDHWMSGLAEAGKIEDPVHKELESRKNEINGYIRSDIPMPKDVKRLVNLRESYMEKNKVEVKPGKLKKIYAGWKPFVSRNYTEVPPIKIPYKFSLKELQTIASNMPLGRLIVPNAYLIVHRWQSLRSSPAFLSH